MLTMIILDLFERIDNEIEDRPKEGVLIFAADIDSVVIDIHPH